MDPVVRGRGEHAIEPAELADQLGMNPELVEEINQADRDEHERRHASDRHRQIENPPQQHARARLPQRRRQVEGFALVMNDMGGPEDAHLVVDAVVPVVEEIIGDERADPDAPVGSAEREEREVVIDEYIDANAQRQHEHAGNLAQDSGRHRADRIIEPIDAASQRQRDPEFRRHQSDEHRNGVNDDVQPFPPWSGGDMTYCRASAIFSACSSSLIRSPLTSTVAL